MIHVVKSSLNKVMSDVPKYIALGEEVIGYLIADHIAIWETDHKLYNGDYGTYNKDYVEKHNIQILPIKVTGGTIVNNIGDLGFLVVSPDIYSNWEVAAIDDLIWWLDMQGIFTYRQANDLLWEGNKFVGTGFRIINGCRVAAMFVSMNDDTSWLINNICTKPSPHKGFIGLNRFGICTKDLIDRVIQFTNKWKERGL